MRAYEFITENVSTETSSKIIIDVLISELPTLYRTLRRLAENYFDSHGELGKGFRFIAGGAKSKWYHEVFFKQLKPALYKLSETLPGNMRSDLKTFLNSMIEHNKFSGIESELIPLLLRIGEGTKNQKLIDGAKSATRTINSYYDFLDSLSDTDDEDTAPPKPAQPNPVAQQNASVEDIINDVLSRIDRKHAGEIRNILARSANKLATLQQELTKRGIRL